VKEQSSAYLEKAREVLEQAEAILRIDLYEPAGRSAYLAGFNAAKALIFEATGRMLKKHGTVQSEFSRLVRDDPRVDDQLRAFLGRTYTLKAIADYENRPRFSISANGARRAVETARRFVEIVTVIMQESEPSRSRRAGKHGSNQPRNLRQIVPPIVRHVMMLL
jgi:uncharacterized protein (UPF0332 family)